MKMRSMLLIVLSFLVALLFSMPLQAADLTAFVGYVNPGSIEHNGGDLPLDSGPIYGARLATYFVPNFGMEHTLAFSSDYLFPSSLEAIKEAKGFVYNSNLIINIPAGKVVPYVTVGAGLIYQYGDSDLPLGLEFALNYGGGLKFPRMFGPLGLRFDMRGYRAGAVSNALHMLEMSGGVMFSFGK